MNHHVPIKHGTTHERQTPLVQHCFSRLLLNLTLLCLSRLTKNTMCSPRPIVKRNWLITVTVGFRYSKYIRSKFYYLNLGRLHMIKQIQCQSRISQCSVLERIPRLNPEQIGMGKNRRWSTDRNGEMKTQLFQLVWTNWCQGADLTLSKSSFRICIYLYRYIMDPIV